MAHRRLSAGVARVKGRESFSSAGGASGLYAGMRIRGVPPEVPKLFMAGAMQAYWRHSDLFWRILSKTLPPLPAPTALIRDTEFRDIGGQFTYFVNLGCNNNYITCWGLACIVASSPAPAPPVADPLPRQALGDQDGAQRSPAAFQGAQLAAVLVLVAPAAIDHLERPLVDRLRQPIDPPVAAIIEGQYTYLTVFHHKNRQLEFMHRPRRERRRHLPRSHSRNAPQFFL